MGQQGTITRVWAQKGTRPRVIRQQQFESAYIFGAVCPSTGDAEAIISPLVNSDAMRIHLERISLRVPQGRYAIVLADRAAWHTTAKLPLLDNLSIVPLPPASPELNSAEQIWNWLRNHKLANRCYKGYEDIVDACCNAWNDFADQTSLVQSMCTRTCAVL